VFMMSAVTGFGVSEFLDALSLMLTPKKNTSEIEVTFAEGRARAWLFEQGVVVTEKQTVNGFLLQVFWTSQQKMEFINRHYP
ncbi:MAG: GTPase HflX, partial [Planktomarina sp.]|nr:GTPase HflX [Planktomarina sp.]